MSKSHQLPLFLPIDSERECITRYVSAFKDQYTAQAQIITPDRNDVRAVWSRLAFAILSANTPFEDSVSALGYALTCPGAAEPEKLAKYKCTPAKAGYLNALPFNGRVFRYLRQADESWNAYRLRLQREIKGLGLAKASFAACLLYPLDADLACIDTHMQTVYLGLKGFHSLSLSVYQSVEAGVREIARAAGVNTFLAQWLIWDYTRGIVSNHNIFPGAHKEV